MLFWDDILNHVCGFCEQDFKVESDLDIHIIKHHTKSTNEGELKDPKTINDNYDTSRTDVITKKLSTTFKSSEEDLSKKKVTGRRMFGGLYDTQDDQFKCLNCLTLYKSRNGVYAHLSLTRCGYGVREKAKDKKNYISLYFKEGGGKSTCRTCLVSYSSLTGLHGHLSSTLCGFGDKERSQKVRRNYSQLYTRVGEGVLECLGCRIHYTSLKGIHRHLDKSGCGAMENIVYDDKTSGDKTNDAKKDSLKSMKSKYFHLYTKEEGEEGAVMICKVCRTSYRSYNGIHSHLEKTRCGYGERDKEGPRQVYQGRYGMLGELYTCNNCQYRVSYMGGIHRHLRTGVCALKERDCGKVD